MLSRGIPESAKNTRRSRCSIELVEKNAPHCAADFGGGVDQRLHQPLQVEFGGQRDADAIHRFERAFLFAQRGVGLLASGNFSRQFIDALRQFKKAARGGFLGDNPQHKGLARGLGGAARGSFDPARQRRLRLRFQQHDAREQIRAAATILQKPGDRLRISGDLVLQR